MTTLGAFLATYKSGLFRIEGGRLGARTIVTDGEGVLAHYGCALIVEATVVVVGRVARLDDSRAVVLVLATQI